jgi:Flp pilus assembly protein TadD
MQHVLLARDATRPVSRLLVSTAAAGLILLTLAGCKTTDSDVTGSVSPRNEAEWRRSADSWGERYRANPDDPNAAIRYAQALRATDQRAQAVAVLEQAAIKHGNDKAVLGAYGRALADVGQFERAFDVLSRAHTPAQPDWRILSAQGAVLDQLGRHSDAQRYYANALKIQPNDPGVLTNLGLSYALMKDLKLAESTLRRAVAQPDADIKARQNLALVLGLQGRFAEAESLARADLPPEEAQKSVAELRQMLEDHNARSQQAPPPRRAQRKKGVNAPGDDT